MIVRGPGFTGGKTVDNMVSLIDIPPTIMEGAGAGVPADFHGRSLHQLAVDSDDPDEFFFVGGKDRASATAVRRYDWDDCVFIQISESQVGRCIRTRQWKYSVRAEADGWKDSGADIYYEDFLYDLDDDPHERKNLISDPLLRLLRTKLAKKLQNEMEKAGERRPVILPADKRPRG
jgi:uncharacterized sulfatase